MLQKKIVIHNKLGLHARASAKLVECASRFASEIWIVHGERRVNAKSIMGVMMLAANKGIELEFIIKGEDEVQALESLEHLIQNKFNESE